MTTADFERRARLLMEDLAKGELRGLTTAPGMCQQFAGKFFTIVTGQHYLLDGAADNAKAAYYELKRTGRGVELDKTDKLQPGDVLFWTSGDYGHVAIHVGGGRIIENTTSGRGERVGPKTGNIRSGTTIRQGYHAMRFPTVIKSIGPVRLIVNGVDTGLIVERQDDRFFIAAPIAEVAAAFGYSATDHSKDTGKVECYLKGAG